MEPAFKGEEGLSLGSRSLGCRWGRDGGGRGAGQGRPEGGRCRRHRSGKAVVCTNRIVNGNRHGVLPTLFGCNAAGSRWKLNQYPGWLSNMDKGDFTRASKADDAATGNSEDQGLAWVEWVGSDVG